MSEVKEKEVVKIKPSESLLSKRRKNILVDPLDENNSVTIQVLGICSALAVTIKLEPTIVIIPPKIAAKLNGIKNLLIE